MRLGRYRLAIDLNFGSSTHTTHRPPFRIRRGGRMSPDYGAFKRPWRIADHWWRLRFTRYAIPKPHIGLVSGRPSRHHGKRSPRQAQMIKEVGNIRTSPTAVTTRSVRGFRLGRSRTALET